MNYTVITSQCKGPNYSADRCCPPLKQLLCPVKDHVNDLKSDCADVFFSYVNLYGKYPPGLFSTLCKEGKEGLDCEGVVVAKNGASCAASSSLVMVIATLALIMFCYIWWECDVCVLCSLFGLFMSWLFGKSSVLNLGCGLCTHF